MSTASGKIGHKEIAKLHQRGNICWDGQLKGFGARRSENSVTFVLMYRTREGRQRWYTIGRYGSPWAPDTAREEAKRLLYEVARGDDPAEVKIKARYAETVEDLCNEYIEEAASGRLRIRGGRAGEEGVDTQERPISHRLPRRAATGQTISGRSYPAGHRGLYA
jgi:Arm DNA-binding domain